MNRLIKPPVLAIQAFQTKVPPPLNTWQTWNALEGGWWDNNGVLNPGTGVGLLASYLAANSGVLIEGISLRVGYASPGDNFNGYVDDVTIGTAAGTTTYDFEPSTVPEPTTIIAGASMLLPFGASALRMVRKKQTE